MQKEKDILDIILEKIITIKETMRIAYITRIIRMELESKVIEYEKNCLLNRNKRRM